MDANKPHQERTAEERVELYTFETVRTKRALANVEARLEKAQNEPADIDPEQSVLSEDETIEDIQNNIAALNKRLAKLDKFKELYTNRDKVDSEIERLEAKHTLYTNRLAVLTNRLADLKQWRETLPEPVEGE